MLARSSCAGADLHVSRLRLGGTRRTGVGIVGTTEQAVGAAQVQLRRWGFPAGRLVLEDGGWKPPQPGALLCYRPGSRTAALALAGDLELPATSVVKVGDVPRKLVLVLPD